MLLDGSWIPTFFPPAAGVAYELGLLASTSSPLSLRLEVLAVALQSTDHVVSLCHPGAGHVTLCLFFQQCSCQFHI